MKKILTVALLLCLSLTLLVACSEPYEGKLSEMEDKQLLKYLEKQGMEIDYSVGTVAEWAGSARRWITMFEENIDCACPFSSEQSMQEFERIRKIVKDYYGIE